MHTSIQIPFMSNKNTPKNIKLLSPQSIHKAENDILFAVTIKFSKKKKSNKVENDLNCINTIG